MFLSKHLFENLTEDVVLKAVMLNESHVAIAFTADISNQTPAIMKASETWFSSFFPQQITRKALDYINKKKKPANLNAPMLP